MGQASDLLVIFSASVFAALLAHCAPRGGGCEWRCQRGRTRISLAADGRRSTKNELTENERPEAFDEIQSELVPFA